jgi:hypothetical protein
MRRKDVAVSALSRLILLRGKRIQPKPRAETSQSRDPIFRYFIAIALLARYFVDLASVGLGSLGQLLATVGLVLPDLNLVGNQVGSPPPS